MVKGWGFHLIPVPSLNKKLSIKSSPYPPQMKKTPKDLRTHGDFCHPYI